MLVGVALAIAVLNLFAVMVGAVAGRFIPVTAVKIGAGALFLAFGLWSLLVKEKEPPEEDCEVKSGRYVILAVTGAFLLAEIGDKTQLATLSLGARFDGSIWDSLGVWLGTSVGMILANVLAVVVGHFAGRRIPAKLMKRISAVLLTGFGIWTLVDALA